MCSGQGFILFEEFFADSGLKFVEISAVWVGVSFLLPSSLSCFLDFRISPDLGVGRRQLMCRFTASCSFKTLP